MKRKTEKVDLEPHVFDQTNGVVDLGGHATPADLDRDKVRNQTISGIAMLSANRPAG